MEFIVIYIYIYIYIVGGRGSKTSKQAVKVIFEELKSEKKKNDLRRWSHDLKGGWGNLHDEDFEDILQTLEEWALVI